MTLTSTPAEAVELAPDDPVVVGEQPLPAGVSELGRQSRRPDDVGEQHGREHPARIEHRPDAGHEVLDLGDDRVLVAGPDEVVGAGQLDVLRARDVLGEVAPVRDAEAHGGLAVDDQRRDADRRQHVPNVALVDEADDRLGAARASPRCARTAPTTGGVRSSPATDGANRSIITPRPVSSSASSSAGASSAIGAPIGKSGASRNRAKQSTRMRLETRSGWAAAKGIARIPPPMFAISAARSDPTVSSTAGMSAMNSSRVGRVDGRDRVRQARPPLVEHDQAAERRQPLSECRQRRHVPLGVEIAEPLVEQQDVGRPVAHDLVRKVEVAESGVAGLRKHELEG